jgi:hypothetical protein
MNGNKQYGFGFQREDFGPSLISAGLSMLANNDGRMNTAQLIGNGGLDALAGLQARKQYEAAMARQQMQDERAQAQHDLQMQKGQFELDEANRKAELMKRWQAGDMGAYKILFPEQWLADQRQARDHAHALKVAAINAAKNGRKGTYDPKLGGVVYTDDASFVPVKLPEGYKAPKEAAQEEQKQLTGNIILEDIARARAKANDYFIVPNAGPGSVFASVPGTKAADLSALVDSIKSGISRDTLQQMRNNSPTGGALGNVSNKDITLLESALGSLSTSQSTEQLLENLDRIERIYADTVHGAGNWRIVDGQIVVGTPEMVTEKPGNRGTGKRPSLSSFKR